MFTFKLVSMISTWRYGIYLDCLSMTVVIAALSAAKPLDLKLKSFTCVISRCYLRELNDNKTFGYLFYLHQLLLVQLNHNEYLTCLIR